MKIKTLITVFAIPVLMMTGCTKKEEFVMPTRKATIEASSEKNNPSTRVGFDRNGTFYWSENDMLGVTNTHNDSFYCFTLNPSGKGKVRGSFSGMIYGNVGDYAVYPYRENHIIQGTVLNYEFPANYDYSKVDTDFFTMPQGKGQSFNPAMWGRIINGGVTMKHLGGVFCIKIDKMPFSSGRLTLKSDKKINGTYTADLSATDPDNIMFTAGTARTEAEKMINITFSGAAKNSSGVFYIPVPTGTFNVRIILNDGTSDKYNVPCGNQVVGRCDLTILELKTENISAGGDEPCDNLTFTANGVSFEMVYVKGGTFWMGAQNTNSSGQNYDSYAQSDEHPVHQVTLTQDYWIGQTEVTQALWKAVMGTDIRHQRDLVNPDWPLYGEGDSYPMYYVSWNDIQTFLSKLNSITGRTFVLPTEAEWEFAARGGTKSNGYKYSGSNTVGNVAWYNDNSSSSTHSVGTKQSNELGIYDMSGNVWEWCKDWHGNYDGSSQTNPQGPSSGSYRVLRGGLWNCSAGGCRVAYRHFGGLNGRGGGFGFRLAIDGSDPAPVPVTGVSLDKTSLTLTEGESYTLTATVSPSYATNKNVTWKSNNTSVATVNNSGRVTAVSAGSAMITVITEDGGKTATCSVTVDAGVSYINIPNANFKAYLINGTDTETNVRYDLNGDGKISYTEAGAITKISVCTDNIESLEGIEAMTNLKDLSAYGTSASESWTSNGKLTTLDISNNTALQHLYCDNNQLTSLDVSNNTALQTLHCGDNQLTSLNVSNNTALESLYCNYNQLTSLDVSNNPVLTTLECRNNQLTSLDVNGCIALTVLYCNYNQLTSLDVSNNTELKTLYCVGNQLTSLDVSNNTKLTELACSDNQLTSLDVNGCIALIVLSCVDNQLTSLDVNGCIALTELACSYNQLTSLDVNGCRELQRLDCSNNQLTSLDVSNNTNLNQLDCSNNQLTELNINNWSMALTNLDCSNNQLTSLDVNGCIALTELHCWSNQLTELDISNNTALYILDCSDNPDLTKIWVWSTFFDTAHADFHPEPPATYQPDGLYDFITNKP